MADYPSTETLAAWANCATPDCENKASARRNSLFCDPCTTRMNADSSAPDGYFDELRRVQRETEQP